MTTQTAEVEYLRTMTTGTIHAVEDLGGWNVRALCGTRNLTGNLVYSTPDKMWRNDDYCQSCAAAEAKRIAATA